MKRPGFSIEIDAAQLAHVRRSLQATRTQYLKAEKGAVRKTVRWAALQAARGVSKADRISVGTLYGARSSSGHARSRTDPKSRRASRVRTHVRSSGDAGSVWLGIDAIPASYLGKARQTRGGVRVGSRRFEKSFLLRFKSGYTGVFTRVGQGRSAYEQEYAYLRSARAAISAVEARVPLRLKQNFAHELRYRVDIAK